MKKNIIAIVLAAALVLCALPSIDPQVRAQDGSIAQESLDGYLFSTDAGKIYDGEAADLEETLADSGIEITASQEGKETVTLLAGVDCEIAAKSPGEWKNTGEYLLAVTPKEGGRYIFEEQEVSYRIAPLALSDASVELSAETVFWTGDILTSEQWPKVTLKNGERPIPESDYQTQIAHEVSEAGTYTILILPAEGNPNLTGSAEKPFEVKYDESIQGDSYYIDGESCVEKDGVYYYKDASKVVIRPAEGYVILESGMQGGSYRDGTFVLADGATEIAFRIRRREGAGREVKLSGFVKDINGPAITFAKDSVYMDGEKTWGNCSPQFTLTDMGAGTAEQVAIEYRIEGEDAWNVFTGLLPDKIMEGTVCYFRAVDRLGNVTEEDGVISFVLDKGEPQIEVDSSGESVSFAEDGTAKLYFNRSGLDADGKKVFAASIFDAGSGIKETSVTVGETAGNALEPIVWSPQDLEMAEYQTIVIEAADYTQNKSRREISIYYDPNAPQIGEIQLNGTKQNQIKSKEDVTVSVTVTDAVLNGQEQIGFVSLVNASDSNESVAMERRNGSDVYECRIMTDDFLEKTYRISVEDLAQNKVESGLISVSVAKDAPKIKSVRMDESVQVNEAGWVNKDALFLIDVEEPGSWPSKIGYYLQYRSIENKDVFSESDTAWQWAVDENGEKLLCQKDDAGNCFFSFLESNDVFDGEYAFRIQDEVGNASAESRIYLKKDKVLPEIEPGEALVKYESDTMQEDGGHGFLEGLSHFFGRDTVTAYLYIPQDRISGVSSIEYEYDGKRKEAGVNKGYAASIGGRDYAEFTITLEPNAADTLKITEIADFAGNIVKKTNDVLPVAEGKTIIVVDNVKPALEVDYKDADIGQDQKGSDTDAAGRKRKYYAMAGSAYKEIALTFTERFFLENTEEGTNEVKKPVIKVNGEPADEVGGMLEWGAFAPDSQTITATLKLPFQKNQETEYALTVSYQDGSKNPLMLQDTFWRQGSDEGEYESGTVVLDDKAPELNHYGIKEEPAEHKVKGVSVYPNREGNDVTITFTVEEKADYWHKENLRFVIRDLTHGKVMADVAGTAIHDWQEDADFHTAEYSFDGEDDTAANYRAEITYRDMAGNTMTEKTGFKLQDGRYVSEEFILDHVAPVYQIVYNAAYRLVNNSNTAVLKDRKNEVPQTGYTAYYKNDITASVYIKEAYAHPVEENGTILSLSDFVLTVNGKTQDAPRVRWSYDEAGGVYTGTFLLSKEQRYQLGITYCDAAGNTMTEGENVQGAKQEKTPDGAYQSETLVVDKTSPVITASYTDQAGNPLKPIQVYGKRKYFNRNAYLKVEVKEVNLRNAELKKSLQKIWAYKVSEQKADTRAEKFINGITDKTLTDGAVWSIPLTTESNYDIPIAFEDLAGNTAVAETEYSCVDTSKPEDIKFTYKVAKSGYMDIINYKNFGFAFADHKLTVTASAKDKVSGIRFLEFTVKDENGKKKVFTKEYKPSAHKSASIALPISGKNFKGSVSVKVTDYSDNAAKREQGQVVETGAQHKQNSMAVITTKTSPSRTVDGIDFYNSDVALHLLLKDSYSGIGSFSYTAGSLLEESKDYTQAAGNDTQTASEQKIVKKVDRDLILSSQDNNVNDVKVRASFTDNAGHKSEVEESYNIDVTPPVIQVTYDRNDPLNGTYYKDTRTATVVITERNFDENDVQFTVTNTDGVMPQISNFVTAGNGDETTHTATVTFSEDGDYTFGLSFMDLAGNKAVYENTDEFTIDKTLPEYVVTYDNNSAVNGYYYSGIRTATIDILEHNFDPSSVTVSVTKDNSSASSPVISGWTKNGDHNVAAVSFHTDGEYTFTFAGLDLAGNEIAAYTQDHFVVDTTAPEIEISGIENFSANNGSVQPKIRYKDINFDESAEEIVLTGVINGECTLGKNGFHNEAIDIPCERILSAGDVEIRFSDFGHTKKMDDLYTMYATVYDKAGNSAKAELKFSVNRFGSVYAYEPKTNDLVGENGKYYTNEKQDIVVTETNVDSLGFREITCSCNGELMNLEEGEHYTVMQSGTKESWKQYTYSIYKELFEDEGTYIITIYSEDQAKNQSDNNTKGKRIEFVLDTTPPSIVVSGVEDNGQYREESKSVTVDVEDNVRLADVVVETNRQKTTYAAEELLKSDGRINLTIPGDNQWQTLQITANDAAENHYQFKKIRYLVTVNLLIQFIRNETILWGSCISVAVSGIGFACLYLAKRRKKRENSDSGDSI